MPLKLSHGFYGRAEASRSRPGSTLVSSLAVPGPGARWPVPSRKGVRGHDVAAASRGGPGHDAGPGLFEPPRRKSQRRRGIGPSRADFEARRDNQVLLAGLQTMIDGFETEKEREQQARRSWTGGIEPPQATLTRWRDGSAGDRFFSVTTIADAVSAPRLGDATLPSPQQMAEDPGHWVTAVSVLIRAVVLDGVSADDPAITRVLDLLTPVVRAEIAAETREDEDFPDTSGPLFLLGSCTLIDATWAIVGLDPLDQALSQMQSRIDEALAGAEGIVGPAGKAIAEALIRTFADEYQCTEPRDVQVLERLGPAAHGNPLVDLVQAEHVAQDEVLRLGLVTLAALAALASTDADSPAGH